MFRMRGECEAIRNRASPRWYVPNQMGDPGIVCVRPRGHSGPHASEWISHSWGPLHRYVWVTLEIEGREVTALPAQGKYGIDDTGIQRAMFGNWAIYLPTVPHPRIPQERTEEECPSE